MICGLSVEWNKGDTREYSFEIEVSSDGNNFEKVFQGSTNSVFSLRIGNLSKTRRDTQLIEFE
jgi:hypothetical protein